MFPLVRRSQEHVDRAENCWHGQWNNHEEAHRDHEAKQVHFQLYTTHPLPLLPWDSEMMAHRFKRTFGKNLLSLCWPKRTVHLAENRENRQKNPIPISDLIPQKETCQTAPFCSSAWEQRDGLSRCWGGHAGSQGERIWRKGQYPFFLAMSPLPPNPGAKVKGAALCFGSTKLLVSSLFCQHPSDHDNGAVHSDCSVEQHLPQHGMASTSCRKDLITTRSRAVKPGMRKSPLTWCGLCIIAFPTSSWPTMGWVEFLSLRSHFLSSALWAVLALVPTAGHVWRFLKNIPVGLWKPQ